MRICLISFKLYFGAKVHFFERTYRGGNIFMRCGIYVRVSTVGYVIKYSVGSMNCKLVAFKCLILPFLTV